MTRSRTLAAVPVLVATLALVAGCGTPTVSKADVEKKVSAQLEEQVGRAPDDVTCPGDLTGKVGTTMRCTLTDGSDKVGLTVDVTDVDGSKVGFDIKVDDHVQSGS